MPGHEFHDARGDRRVVGNDVAAPVLDDHRVGEAIGQRQRITDGHDAIPAPGDVVPPRFDGAVLHPDPPVERRLSVYTRVHPDPITEVFVDAISDEALVTPAHILALLRSAGAR